MKAWIPLTLVFALCSAASAEDACNHPGPPATPPDGNSATKDEMIAGSKVTKQYTADMDAYLACLQAKMDSIPNADPKNLKGDEKAAAETNKKEKDAMTKKYDAAVDEEKANAEQFNVQLRAWKAKNK